MLALSGGVWIYASGQHFPLASQVQGTFLSFKILPTVLETLFKPFGHPFKVTAKGGTSETSHYAQGIFWIAASFIGLTVFGLIINTIPDWRIVETEHMLPVVAFWSAFNVIVLFLVCMMSLQAPRRRGEERVALDLPIQIVGPTGVMSKGRVQDISLSGMRLEADTVAASPGDTIRAFITEVGFLSCVVVRKIGPSLGVKFILPPSMERDLLIRKMFTAGLDTTTVNASAWSATSAMFKSMWGMRTEMLPPAAENLSDVIAVAPVPKLPARSLIISPQGRPSHLAGV